MYEDRRVEIAEAEYQKLVAEGKIDQRLLQHPKFCEVFKDYITKIPNSNYEIKYVGDEVVIEYTVEYERKNGVSGMLEKNRESNAISFMVDNLKNAEDDILLIKCKHGNICTDQLGSEKSFNLFMNAFNNYSEILNFSFSTTSEIASQNEHPLMGYSDHVPNFKISDFYEFNPMRGRNYERLLNNKYLLSSYLTMVSPNKGFNAECIYNEECHSYNGKINRTMSMISPNSEHRSTLQGSSTIAIKEQGSSWKDPHTGVSLSEQEVKSRMNQAVYKCEQNYSNSGRSR